MSASVIPFPHVNGAEASGCTMRADSFSDLRQKAWMNFYSAERRDGVKPELASERADYFITKRFDGLIDDIREIMGAAQI
jgi:hypothetical protein